MMTEPTKPSLGNTSKKMDMADKMFDYSSKPKKMAAGGYVKAADGCAKRGKTKGRFV